MGVFWLSMGGVFGAFCNCKASSALRARPLDRKVTWAPDMVELNPLLSSAPLA